MGEMHSANYGGKAKSFHALSPSIPLSLNPQVLTDLEALGTLSFLDFYEGFIS